MNLDMELQIHEIGAVCDYVQGVMKSPKRLWLSFDEWNVWYRARDRKALDGQRTFAPKLLEEVYNLEDALLVGGFINSLLRTSDRVRLACLAQIMNVIAPLVTNKTSVLRQSIYYPYAWALQYARGRVLDLQVEGETYPISGAGLRADFARNDQVPYIDVAATLDPSSGQAAVLMLNRDTAGEREVVLDWQDADADARRGVSDTDGTGSESIQHVRATADGRPASVRRAATRRAHDVQAAAALVHGRSDRDEMSGQLAAAAAG